MYKELLRTAYQQPLQSAPPPPPPKGEPHILVGTALATRKEQEDTSTVVQAPQTRRELLLTSTDKGTKRPLQRNMQVIVQPECPVAIGTFSRSR